MGSRQTHWIGLNSRARKLLDGDGISVTEEVVHVYPDGRREVQSSKQVVLSAAKPFEARQYHGLCGEVFELQTYRLPDGSELREVVQDEVWSSGPAVFTCLEDQTGELVSDSLWTREEIDAATWQ